MRIGRVVPAIATLWLVLHPASTFAQLSTGTVAGVVRDESGAVLPGVTVEASSPALIEKTISAVTDSVGQYKIVNLRPGAYSVTFTLPGFSVVKREGLELNAGFTATVNADMKVGGLEETITAVALDGTSGVKVTIDNVPTHKSGAITNISVAANATVTVPGHTFVSGDVMVVSGVVGMTEFNDLQVTIDVVTGSSFTCGVDSSAFITYVSGGTISTLNEIRYANIGFVTAFGTTNPDGYVASERPRGCLRDDSERTTSDGSVINAWALHEAGFTVTVT